MKKQQIAILASGNGSNAIEIIKYFQNNTKINVSIVIANNNLAPVLQKCKNFSIPSRYFSNDAIEKADELIHFLKKEQIDYLVLAGFLRKIPPKLISCYKDKIINIHPSILPKFGGKGMFGKSVHQAVFDAKELFSGISIHLVNENFDEGEIIKQFKVEIKPEDTPNDIEIKVRSLELKNFAPTIEAFILT